MPNITIVLPNITVKAANANGCKNPISKSSPPKYLTEKYPDKANAKNENGTDQIPSQNCSLYMNFFQTFLIF